MYFTDLEHQTKFSSHMHMSLLYHNMNTILFMKTTAPTMLTSAVVEKFLYITLVLLYFIGEVTRKFHPASSSTYLRSNYCPPREISVVRLAQYTLRSRSGHSSIR